MTGDIRKILSSSEAAKSLQMEAKIAQLLRGHKWNEDRGVYYKDIESGKLREMDVYGVQTFFRPERRKGTGGPIINLHLFCECKSLSGSNILFSEAPTSNYVRNSSMNYWIGWEDQLHIIIRKIVEQTGTEDFTRIKALFEYAMDRAYPGEGTSLNRPVSLTPPPVEVLASAFRETKRGKLEEGEALSDRSSRAAPLWNAIRSSLSAAEAARNKAQNTSLEWVYGLDPAFYGLEQLKESVAFFLDAELMRSTYFHPFIVLNAKLWKLGSAELEEVNSARIFIRSIGHPDMYVDIVAEAFVDQYIQSMVTHYEKASRRSIRKLWNLVDEIGWYPAEREQALGEALGIANGA